MAKKRQTDRHKGKMFGFRLPPDIADEVRSLAKEEMRPYSNMIVVLVTEAINARVSMPKGTQQ